MTSRHFVKLFARTNDLISNLDFDNLAIYCFLTIVELHYAVYHVINHESSIDININCDEDTFELQVSHCQDRWNQNYTVDPSFFLFSRIALENGSSYSTVAVQEFNPVPQQAIPAGLTWSRAEITMDLVQNKQQSEMVTLQAVPFKLFIRTISLLMLLFVIFRRLLKRDSQ